jgi:hypothetical protein
MNSTLKKFYQFTAVADMLRDQSEELNELITKELGRTDEALNFSELERSGKKLDEAIAYRDYLWQMKHLIDQVEGLNSDKLVIPDQNLSL